MRRYPTRRATLALLVTALLTLTGCAAGGGRSTSTGSARAQVVIVNESNATIFRIFMSPTSQRTWGPDQLGSEVLLRGNRFRLTDVRPGTWDIRLVDRNGNWKEFRNQRLRAGRVYTLRVNARGWTKP